MSDNVYKLIEITGTSTTGIKDAIQNAWQVTIKVGFNLEG